MPAPHQTQLKFRVGSRRGAVRALLMGLWAMGLAPAQTALAQPGADRSEPEPSGAPSNPIWRANPKDFQEKPLSSDTLRRLRSGGFVLYLRHGETQNDRVDQLPVDLKNCATQRLLSDEGRATARRVGAAIARARIPVTTLVSSPMCRTVETAQLAFGRRPETDSLLMYTAQLSSQQKLPRVDALRDWLSRPPAVGANVVLVAHGPNLMDLMGYFPKEGVLSVFEPQGSSFTYLGSVAPSQWALLVP